MAGMERRGGKNYYLIKIKNFSEKEGFYKTFVVLDIRRFSFQRKKMVL